MLKVINKHLSELSDNDLLQSLIYLLKQQASNHSYTYNEVEVSVFFNYITKNILSKDKHRIKASKIIDFIHYYKNELYGLKRFPIFSLFIRSIYKNNINIDYSFQSLSDSTSGFILLKLFSSTLSLNEFKRFILKQKNNNTGLLNYFKEGNIEYLVDAYQHNVKLSMQYFKWLFLNQKELKINLFNSDNGFEIWKNFVGEAHYNSLVKWVINNITLEQLTSPFSLWGEIDPKIVYFGDFLLLNGNKNNISQLIKKFENNIQDIFIFSPTNTLCSNETLKIKELSSLYQILLKNKTDNLFMNKNDLFSFIEAQTNSYIEQEHSKFIAQLIDNGNELNLKDSLNRDCIGLSLTSKQNAIRVGLFELLWPYMNQKNISINYQNTKGHNILHLLLTLNTNKKNDTFSLYINSGKSYVDESNIFTFHSYESYFDEKFKFLKQHHFDFSSLSDKENNALHFAFLLKHKENIVLKLIEYGVSLIQKNKYGFEPYSYLIKNKAFYKKDFIEVITTFYEKEKLEKLNIDKNNHRKKLKL